MILAASFALTNCAMEQVGSNDRFDEGIPYEIRALSSDTKTAVDGMSTKWVASDAVNLFHAVAGTADYVSDNSFAIAEADLADGRFKGTLSSALDAGESYDWYALYPYSSRVTTPAAVETGYITVGGKTQKQSGLNSMAHLSGEACPLYGISKNVSADEIPAIQMHHLTSIIEINVTNSCGEPLDVTSVSFTGTEDIAGTFYVNFVSDPVGYIGSDAKYVSNTASLSVTGAEPIADGASAKFYIAVKPFTAPAGSTLKIAVNGYEKELVIPAEKSVTFSAGKIKTLNFGYDYVVDPDSPVWDLSIDSTCEATTEKIAWTSNWADMVCKKAENGTAANNYYPGTQDKSYTSTRFYTNSILTITPKSDKTLTYYTFEATSETYAAALENSTWTNVKASNAATSSPYIVTIVPKNPAEPVSAVLSGTCGLTSVKICSDEAPVFAPVINVVSNTVGIAAAGGNAEIEYTVKNPVDGQTISASSDGPWITGIDYYLEGKVLLTVSQNTGEARTAIVTLSYEGAENVNVMVSQNSLSSTKNYIRVESQLSDWRGDYVVAYSNSVFMDGSLPGGTSAGQVGYANTGVNPESALSEDGKTIDQTWGDRYYVTIEAIDDTDLTKGYVIKTHSATNPYFYQTSNANGMSGSANKTTASNYPISITFVSVSDIRIALGGNATGAVLRYNSSNNIFRYYKDGGQSAIYLYKKEL